MPATIASTMIAAEIARPVFESGAFAGKIVLKT